MNRRALERWAELRSRFFVPQALQPTFPEVTARLRFNQDIEDACRGHFVNGWDEALRWREGAEYTLLEATYAPDIACLAQELLREGWRPLGGPVLSWGDDRIHYAQAMVRGVTP